MFYFKNFPTVDYKMKSDFHSTPIINILRRFKPLQEVLNKSVIYYNYEVKDGERPDVVADKIYRNVEYDWIILLFNERSDPYWAWPMSYQDFRKYLEDKYGSFEASTQQIHHYEKIVQSQQTLYDGTIIPERTLVIQEDTYDDLHDYERRIVYAYDYEERINERNRQIKLVDSSYIPQILSEKERIFR